MILDNLNRLLLHLEWNMIHLSVLRLLESISLCFIYSFVCDSGLFCSSGGGVGHPGFSGSPPPLCSQKSPAEWQPHPTDPGLLHRRKHICMGSPLRIWRLRFRNSSWWQFKAMEASSLKTLKHAGLILRESKQIHKTRLRCLRLLRLLFACPQDYLLFMKDIYPSRTNKQKWTVQHSCILLLLLLESCVLFQTRNTQSSPEL